MDVVSLIGTVAIKRTLSDSEEFLQKKYKNRRIFENFPEKANG
jgi:hypothetical protein